MRILPMTRPGPARWLAWPLCALFAMTMGAVPPAAAGPGRDDDRRALAAREGGRILPLELLIRQVEALIPGRLLEAELDQEDGVPVYELRWQLADGRRLEIELDARDGRWRSLEGPRLETVFRRPAAAPEARR